MNEISTKVKDLNLWQKMRLKFFIGNLKFSGDIIQKYNNAPDYIKQREEVIAIIVERIKEGKIILDGTIEQGVIDRIDIESKRKLFVQFVADKRYGELKHIQLGKYERVALVDLEYSDKDGYDERLEQIITYLNNDTIIGLKNEIFTNPRFMEAIKYLNDDIINRLSNYIITNPRLIECLSIEQEKLLLKEIPGYEKMLQYFSEDLQYEYAKNNPQTLSECSDIVRRRFIEENVYNIRSLSDKQKIQLLEEDFTYIRYMDSDSFDYNRLLEYITENPDANIENIMVHSKMYDAVGCLGSTSFHMGFNADVNKKAREVSLLLNRLNIEQIESLGKIDSNYIINYFVPGGSYQDSKFNSQNSIQKCFDLFEMRYGKERLNEYHGCIEGIFKRFEKWLNNKNTEEIPLAELKILFNDEIMENCNPELIQQYFDNVEQGLECKNEFRKIILQAYGDKAVEILDNREQLNVYNINSLEIFDSRILNTFSSDFINDLISYNFRGISAFLGMTKDPQKLENFKLYYDTISSIMGQNAAIMQKAILEFDYVSKLLDNISYEELNEVQLQNLISVLCSSGNKCNISTIEELDNFEYLANENLKKRLKCLKSDSEYRETILDDVFGMTEFQVKQFVSLFDISEEELCESSCSESEKCLINSLSFIMENTDRTVLEKFANEVLSVGGMRSPIALYTGMEKVRERQVEIFNSQFLTRNQMDILIEEGEKRISENGGEPLIYKYIDDMGVEHYRLNGIPFSALYTRLTLGGKQLTSYEAVQRFLEYDGQRGASTISCSLVRSGTQGLELMCKQNKLSLSRDRNNPTFVFMQPIEPSTFLCKGNNDMGVTNGVKLVNPEHNIQKSRIMDTSDIEKMKSYNEVAMFRRTRKHGVNSHGGVDRRIVPDFYIGQVDEGIANLLKKYHIPVLEVVIEKYPVKSYDEKISEKGEDMSRDL